MEITPKVLDELLARAIWFMRTGQHAYGEIAFMGFLKHADQKWKQFEPELEQATDIGDYLRKADVLKYAIAPLYPAE